MTMKSISETLSSSTKKQTYLYIFLILCIYVPAVEYLLGNSSGLSNLNLLALYTGSIFTLWLIPALFIRFLSIKSGYIVFLIFTTVWTIGANSSKSSKEEQASIARSIAKVSVICATQKHMQKNYCSDYQINTAISKTCETDLVLLAPNEMQEELRKSLNSATTIKMISDLFQRIDSSIIQESKEPNFSINSKCEIIDKTTAIEYEKEITNINLYKNK